MTSLNKLLTVALLAAVTWIASAEGRSENTRVPVLLELFTSEGCSSCPPADRLLETLDRTQPISGADLIVLSEHVDYWNDGGWHDPYSSAEITKRQREYGNKFRLDSVYTPQLVVDGMTELVGSRGAEASSAIEHAIREHKGTVQLSVPVRNGNLVTVHVELAPSSNKNAFLCVALADGRARSQVARGENSGRSLTHVAVVRTLASVGMIPAGSSFTKDIVLPVPPGVGASGLRVVVFAQDRSTGHILAVSQQKL
jgi:hypothetical protein